MQVGSKCGKRLSRRHCKVLGWALKVPEGKKFKRVKQKDLLPLVGKGLLGRGVA